MTGTPPIAKSKAPDLNGAARVSGELGFDPRSLETIRASLPDRPFMMEDVSWEDYQALTTILEEPAIRATYDRGYLELRMPLFIHEKIAIFLGMMAHALCATWRIRLVHAGSTTLRREDLEVRPSDWTRN